MLCMCGLWSRPYEPKLSYYESSLKFMESKSYKRIILHIGIATA
jgi:hypothetical protein